MGKHLYYCQNSNFWTFFASQPSKNAHFIGKSGRKWRLLPLGFMKQSGRKISSNSGAQKMSDDTESKLIVIVICHRRAFGCTRWCGKSPLHLLYAAKKQQINRRHTCAAQKLSFIPYRTLIQQITAELPLNKGQQWTIMASIGQ